MKTLLLISLILIPTLYADTVSEEDLHGIYIEAILFVTVFGIMAIISYIYSNKHAKKYKSKKEKASKDIVKNDRIEELLELLKRKLITKKEFELLKEYYLH